MAESSEVDRHLDMALQANNGNIGVFIDGVFRLLASNTDFYSGYDSKSAIAGVMEAFVKYEALGIEPPEKKRKTAADNKPVSTNDDQSVNEVVAPDSDSGLIEVLEMRRKNMRRSKSYFSNNLSFLLDKKYPSVCLKEIPRIDEPIDNDPWNIFLPLSLNYLFEFEDGIIRVFENKQFQTIKKWKNYEYISRDKFVEEMQFLSEMNENPALNAFCKERLDKLKTDYQVYWKISDKDEKAEQEKVRNDFYSVMKVDTHLHAAGCSTLIRFLRFLRKKFLHNGSDVVYRNAEGKLLTLKEVFELEGLKEEDLNLDRLNMHADDETFCNFDSFNSKFKPFGSKILREIFLKTKNHIKGKYFAELIKEVMAEFSDENSQSGEIRLTIYGKDYDEWASLAKWAEINKLYSKNIRWIIQIPRIFDKIKIEKPNHTFEDILINFFTPLFEVTSNAYENPVLHAFLKCVVGIDLVDDESDPTDSLFGKDAVTPQNWIENTNPAYNYYMYYFYTNLAVLNQFRWERGLSLLSLRPHCGEAGPPHHLATAFMCAESISHGLVLKKVPVLQYLYYICKIGIGMAPISNNYLFVEYEENPILQYLQQGLNVSLSTDDPTIFHITETPLLEEFSKAAHSFKLTSAEMCELARNSVLMSGFDKKTKEDWAGRSYRKEFEQGNMKKSNVPVVLPFVERKWMKNYN